MAGKKDKFDIEDDFDFNDEFDFDMEGGFEGPPPSGKRKAITQFTGSFTKGVKDTLFSEHFQEETIGKLLPKSYYDGFRELNVLKRQASQFKNEVGGELDKHTKQFKKDNQSTIKQLTSKLPSSISSKINRWADNFDSGYGPSIDTDQLNTESMMSDVFGATAQVANDYQTKATLETNAETKLQTGLASDSNELLFGIGTNIGKLVGYQDDIGIKYQRKMLELTYKQLLTNRKHLSVSEQLLALQTSANRAIVENTGLPDVVKMHKSEILSQTLTHKFIGSVADPLFENTGQIAGRIAGQVTKKIKGGLEDNAGTASSMFSQALGMFLPNSNGYDDPGAMSPGETLAMILGGQASNGVLPGIVDKFAPDLREKLAANGGVSRTGAMLDNYRLRAPGLAKGALLTGDTGFGKLDKLIKFFDLKELSEETNTLIQGSPEGELGKAQVFDLQVKRTVTDIIPGLLGRIHSEMRRFNGDEGHGIVKYDWKMGGFAEEQQLDQRLVDDMVVASKPDNFKLAESSILKSIDPTGKGLSEETRTKIARQVSIATMTGEPISLQHFLDPSSPHYIKEFADFVTKQYKTTMHSNADGTVKSANQFIKEASEDFLVIDNQLQQEVLKLRGDTTDPLQALLARAQQGDISTLKRYPFIKVNSAGVYTIDYPAYYDYLNKQSDIMGPPRPFADPTPNIGPIGSVDNPLTDDSRRSIKQRATDTINNTVSNGTNKLTHLTDPGKLGGVVDVVRDKASSVWVKGETSPRLDAISMRLGKYRLAATGAIIKSVDDITGDVIDDKGEIMLTRHHAMEGLIDQSGSKINIDWGSVAETATNVIGKIKGLPLGGGFQSLMKGKLPKDLGVSATVLKNKLSGWREDKTADTMISISNLKNTVVQTETLGDIKTLLREQLDAVNNKPKFNDRDGDGDRDGGWSDILANRKAERETTASNVTVIQEEKKEKKGGLLSMLMGFIPRLIPMIGGLFSSAFGFAVPAITGLFGSAIRLAIPAAIGALGLKWLANKWLNRDGGPGNAEVIAPDDPRLDPNSELYDPNLQVSDPGVMDKIAGKVKDMGMVGSLVTGYAAIKGAKYLGGKAIGAAGAGALGAARMAGRAALAPTMAAAGRTALTATSAAAATRSLDASLAARSATRAINGGAAGARGAGLLARLGGMAGSTAGRAGLGTAAKLIGKTVLRGFLGPIGLAWLAYDVIKFGYDMYKKHSDDGKKLNRLRMAGYGYHHKDEEHVSKLLAMEGELYKHVGMKDKVAYLKDSISTDQVMEYFNVNRDDTDAVDKWKEYFFGRFMPVFLSYATAMHSLVGKFDIFEMDTVLDPAQQLKACDQVLFSREQGNPYDIMVSGFSGEDKLEMDKTKVMEVYKLVRGTLEVKARKTKGSYVTATEAKDEKTRATRSKQIEEMNKKDEIKKAKEGKIAGTTADDKDSKSIFGSGIMGSKLASVAKAALAPVMPLAAAGGWIADKVGGLFNGPSSDPKFAGKPGKGWNPTVAAAVKWGADQLGIEPNHLASVISFETGGSFDTNKRNPSSSATGLIQLMNYGDGKKDGKYYGMTRDQFGALSHMDQMQYVVKYFQAKGLKPGSSLGKVYDAVTGTGYKRGSKAYELNKVWDANKDGVISPGESVTSGAFKDHMKDYFGSAANEVSASNNGVLGSTNIGKNNTPTDSGVPATKASSAKMDTSVSGVLASKTAAGTKNQMAPGSGVLLNSGSAKSAPQPQTQMFPNAVTPQANGVASPGAVLGTNTRPYLAAAYARKKGLNGSSGYCARYVREALQYGGKYKFDGVGSAYQYHTQGVLIKAGFMQIHAGTKWQVGDVIVYQNSAKHPHGHIQIWDGRNWISDFIQNSWVIYGGKNPFSLWRDKEYLNGAQPGSGWTAADGKNVGGSDGNAPGATFSAEGGVGIGVTPRRKWTQTKAILGGDALYGGSKKVTTTDTQSAKADDVKPTKAKNATPDKEVEKKIAKNISAPSSSSNANTGDKTDTTDKTKVTTTSAKSAEATNITQPASREAKETAKAKEDIVRKEKDAVAKQITAKEQRESDVSILQQQLKIQMDTLSEIRGLRKDMVGFAQSTLAGNKSVQDFIKSSKSEPMKDVTPSKDPNALSPVQAPTSMVEPVSMLKS